MAVLGELLLVAPAMQQTAMSRAFVTDAGAGVVERVGINYGENVGGAIGVSGTVGAAFEASPR